MGYENYYSKLQAWYIQQCDGDWEHEYGVKIDTIDNPGWSLQIDLTGTPQEGKAFERIKIDITENNWVNCWVEENKFQAGGGPLNLDDLIKVFIQWIESENAI